MDAIRVLIVDDETNVCAYLRELLQYFGYQADCVQSCETARRKLAGREYNVVMLDAWLSQEDHDGLLAWLRERQRAESVVIMSEWADFDMWIDYMNKGAADLIAKPCAPSQLEEVVRKAAGEKPKVSALPTPIRRGAFSSLPQLRGH